MYVNSNSFYYKLVYEYTYIVIYHIFMLYTVFIIIEFIFD